MSENRTDRGGEAVLEFDELHVRYELHTPLLQRMRRGGRRSVQAVNGIDLTLRQGEIVGVIGESGSGKSTLGRAAVGLAPISAGSIRVEGADVAGLSRREQRELAPRIQMVFQDPHASLNPTMTVGEAIEDPIRVHRPGLSRAQRTELVHEALRSVGLEPPEEFAARRPTFLSGGQKQRIAIARALVNDPSVIIADEAVAALDMSVRAKVLTLLSDLRDERGISFVYITHDLASARFFCDSIAIMYLGRIVEYGPVDEVFAAPRHPYTRALVAAIPDPSSDAPGRERVLGGEVPDAVAPPRGCGFHPRCPVATALCGWEARDLANHVERYWTTLPIEEYERLSAMIRDIEEDDGGRAARVRPHSGHTPAEIAALLERIRSDTAADRIWLGVRDIETRDGDVRVHLVEPISIPLRVSGDHRVACVLGEDGAPITHPSQKEQE